jgi:hypothetical protein
MLRTGESRAYAWRLCSPSCVGLLLATRSGRLIALSPHTVIGRSPACSVVLDDLRASAEHAAIAWSGECWEIRDLGSRNGTWLDGRRLTSGERASVRNDARLAFGGSDAWLLADDRAAGPAARNEATGEIVHSTTGLLALPSAGNPLATVYRRADGQWLIELGAELRAIPDRAEIDLAGARWSLFLPTQLGPVPTTLKIDDSLPALADISLWFAPSLDEEHVDVRVRTDDGREWLLPPRSSHYTLLTLARSRLEDARIGVASEEQGWLYASHLAEMLQYSPERLNLEIFRARSQFAKLGFSDATHLVARRTVNRQLRIGVSRLHVAHR